MQSKVKVRKERMKILQYKTFYTFMTLYYLGLGQIVFWPDTGYPANF